MKHLTAKVFRTLFIGAVFGVPIGKILLGLVPDGVAIWGAAVVAILVAESGMYFVGHAVQKTDQPIRPDGLSDQA